MAYLCAVPFAMRLLLAKYHSVTMAFVYWQLKTAGFLCLTSRTRVNVSSLSLGPSAPVTKMYGRAWRHWLRLTYVDRCHTTFSAEGTGGARPPPAGVRRPPQYSINTHNQDIAPQWIYQVSLWIQIQTPTQTHTCSYAYIHKHMHTQTQECKHTQLHRLNIRGWKLNWHNLKYKYMKN